MKVRDIMTARHAEREPLSCRDFYRREAEKARDDCFLIDSLWLIDEHPSVWESMMTLDDQLLRMGHAGVADARYRETLTRLVSVVKETRALYERKQAVMCQ